MENMFIKQCQMGCFFFMNKLLIQLINFEKVKVNPKAYINDNLVSTNLLF